MLVASGARSCLPPRLLLASSSPLTFLTCSFKFCSCCTLREDNCPLAFGPCVSLVTYLLDLSWIFRDVATPPPSPNLQMQVPRQRFAHSADGSGAPTHCRTGLKVALCKGTQSTAVNPLGDGVERGKNHKKLSPYTAGLGGYGAEFTTSVFKTRLCPRHTMSL